MRLRFLVAGVAAGLLALTIACGSNPVGPSHTGTLSVSLKDSPFSEAKAVLVTFSEVSIHASGGGWTTIPFPGGGTRTCDLKQLQAATDVLGTGPLAAGHYTQVRLTVSSADLYFANPATGGPCGSVTAAGAKSPVDIPSGQVILNRPFDLAEGATMQMLLDFDGERSINQLGNGNYRMNPPVINIVSVQ